MNTIQKEVRAHTYTEIGYIIVKLSNSRYIPSTAEEASHVIHNETGNTYLFKSYGRIYKHHLELKYGKTK